MGATGANRLLDVPRAGPETASLPSLVSLGAFGCGKGLIIVAA